jgi:hypothetical protein
VIHCNYILICTRLYGLGLVWQETKIIGCYASRLLAESAMREHAGERITTPAGSLEGVDCYCTTMDSSDIHHCYTLANLEVM